MEAARGDEAYAAGHYDEAAALFDHLTASDDFADFLTLPAYARLP